VDSNITEIWILETAWNNEKISGEVVGGDLLREMGKR